MRRWDRLGVLGFLAAMSQGCGSQHELERVEGGQTPLAIAPTTDRGTAPRPLLGKSSTGSTVAVAELEGRKVALVADEDGRAVRIADPDKQTELGHARLEGKPSQLLVAKDGRLYVALRDRAKVVVLEAREGASLEKTSEIATASEPVALASSPDGASLLVSTGWSARLAVHELKSGRKLLNVSLPREPRGVAVSEDGKTAFVAHAVGSRVSRVALEDGKVAEVALGGTDFTPLRPAPCGLGCFFDLDVNGDTGPIPERFERSGVGTGTPSERDAVQGFAVAVLGERAFVPEVLAHRGEAPVGGYGTSESYPSHQPALAAIDASGKAMLRVANQSVRADGSRYNHAGGNRRDGCFLPRAAAADASSGTVLVGCQGTDAVEIYDGSDEPLSRSAKARWHVPKGVTGIAVDETSRTALVWSQFDRALSVIELAAPPAPPDAKKDKLKQQMELVYGPPPPPRMREAVRTMKLEALPEAALVEEGALSAQALRGRNLFHGAGDARISADGRACASCHPDGREDGLTWPTPFGARQTPMLAGRLVDTTAPFGWHGDADTVAKHLTQTFKRLGGRGLTGTDLEDLIAYCNEMATPPREAAEEPPADLAARGRELFFADSVGCAQCHKGGADSDGARHGVGSGVDLDTPSLRYVAGTAPYFHDGRYASLEELLEATQGKMGWATNMSKDDLAALEAYLRTL
jgi:mono/diheme cytochrome c family protein